MVIKSKQGKNKFDPIDRDIIRSLKKAKLRATPAKIARTIGIHPNTAINRIKKLEKCDLINCKTRGNRRYCKVNLKEVKKTFKFD